MVSSRIFPSRDEAGVRDERRDLFAQPARAAVAVVAFVEREQVEAVDREQPRLLQTIEVEQHPHRAIVEAMRAADAGADA